MVEGEQAAAISESSGSISTPAVEPRAPPQRRPRVREVSSKFMSAVASPSSTTLSSTSSSCSDLHPLTSKSPHFKQQQQRNHRRHQDNKETESSLNSADENRPIEKARSLESPFQFQRRHNQPRSVMKLFYDNNNGSKLNGRYSNSSRPNTPTVATSFSSRQRGIQGSTSNAATAAAKLLQSLSSQPLNSSQEETSLVDDSESQSVKSLLDSRSEADMLPMVSVRFLAERNINRDNANINAAAHSSKLSSASSCSRSLNLSQTSLFSSIKGSEKATPAVSRSYSNSVKTEGVPLPPVPPPPQWKPEADSKKEKKGSGYQEDVHSLKLLYNHYLQWRFANAKAEASIQAQRRETERSLYSLVVRISELYDSVKRKRIELEILKTMKTLSTIVQAQMPYLEEWSTFEEDYSNALSEGIQALLNISIQLPIGESVRADVRELGEAMNSALKLMKIIMLHIQSFMPKAEEVEILISELAKVTGRERALFEECGDLLFKTQAYQVEECSLRGHLMQLHQRIHHPGQFQQFITQCPFI